MGLVTQIGGGCLTLRWNVYASELHSITLGPRLGFVVVGGGGAQRVVAFLGAGKGRKRKEGKKGQTGGFGNRTATWMSLSYPVTVCTRV